MQVIPKLTSLCSQENILFLHRGSFNKQALENICKLIENELTQANTPFYLKKRIIHLAIEVVQNIIKHSIPLPKKFSASTIQRNAALCIFGKNEEGDYYITSANTITRKRAEHLQYLIEYLNQLKTSSLQTFYRKSLESVLLFDRKGQMGLVEIVLKSGNPIIFQFKKISTNFVYFMMQVKIKSTSQSIASDKPTLVDVSS